MRVVLLLLMGMSAQTLLAENYPSRPMRIVVPAALGDAIAGRVHLTVGSPVSTLAHVKDGRLRLMPRHATSS